MNAEKEIPRFSTRKRALFLFISLALACLLLLGGVETILRLKGMKPWVVEDLGITIEPEGKFFRPDPLLGYTHLPGTFRVTLKSGFVWEATHGADTLRITHPQVTRSSLDGKEELWIFGGSFTHGWSLNDDETYPWLLQERFPDLEVVNYGVSGYGTIHSLIQFREALKSRQPKVAVLAYAGFHDIRNTFLRERRKTIAPWNKLGPLVQPYARMGANGKLRYDFAKVEYSEFPLMRSSALAHHLEMAYNKKEQEWNHSREVSQALILEFAELARAHGVEFVLAGIHDSAPMLEFARDHGIPAVDISVNLGIPENSNMPHDPHPSALANRIYAQRLESYL